MDLYVNHTITACVQIWDWQCCWHELRQRTECYHKTFHSSTIFFRECLKLHWVWVGTLWNTGRFLRNFFSVSRFLNFIQTFSFGQNQTYTIRNCPDTKFGGVWAEDVELTCSHNLFAWLVHELLTSYFSYPTWNWWRSQTAVKQRTRPPSRARARFYVQLQLFHVSLLQKLLDTL